jgi:hypothetical protein
MKKGGEDMTIIQNNAKIVDTCGQRLLALKKFVKTKTTITASGEQTKLADLVAIYQAAIETRNALVPSRAAFDKALAARDSAEVARQATDKKLKAWVVNEFGAGSQEAQEFGFLPAKVGEKTADTKALAVLKLRATRTARGTKGKRQKEKIKGTIVAPAAPADPAITVPAATPAASTPAAGGSLNGAPSANGATAHS